MHPRAVVDATLGPVVPTPGTVTLDARRASDFVRATAVAGDPAADRGRIERQQQVVAAVLSTALSDTGLLDLPRLVALRPALGQVLTADDADLDQVLALARSMRDLGAAGVTFAAVPTDADPTGQGYVLRATDAAAVFDALRSNAPLPADAPGQSAGPKPSDLVVQVRNASERPGLAGKTADTLRGLGSASARSPTPTSPPRRPSSATPPTEAAAELLADTVPAAATVPDPGANGVLQLVLGRSFDGVVRAPTSTPAAAAAGPSPHRWPAPDGRHPFTAGSSADPA